MIETYSLEHENAAHCAELHSEIARENARESVYCRFTGRKLGEIGEKPRGFDPVEMPEMDGVSISHAIGEDTRDALRMMRLCGRGIFRTSGELWSGED